MKSKKLRKIELENLIFNWNLAKVTLVILKIKQVCKIPRVVKSFFFNFDDMVCIRIYAPENLGNWKLIFWSFFVKISLICKKRCKSLPELSWTRIMICAAYSRTTISGINIISGTSRLRKSSSLHAIKFLTRLVRWAFYSFFCCRKFLDKNNENGRKFGKTFWLKYGSGIISSWYYIDFEHDKIFTKIFIFTFSLIFCGNPFLDTKLAFRPFFYKIGSKSARSDNFGEFCWAKWAQIWFH